MAEQRSIERSLSVFERRMQQRRAAFRRRVRIGWAFVEGPRFVMDTASPQMFAEGWSQATDLTILTNAATLHDLLNGTLKIDAPSPGHLFWWGGDGEAFSVWCGALDEAGTSAVALRAQGTGDGDERKSNRRRRGKVGRLADKR